MEKTYRNICEVIVAKDYCIGCGICAGICPVHVLEMKFNFYGEYQPAEIKTGCLPKCDLCLRGCPFWNQKDNENILAKQLFGNESEIKHTNETGYYLESYVGYSNVDGHRTNGSSGGMATWLLETLLKEGLVDYAVCVTHNPDPKKLFKFSVLNSVEEIRSASRSCYYPVELSEVIDYILHHDGRYAITGLPCFIKGLRLATRQNKRLRERLIYMIGLTCGQMQSKHFAEYLCALKGGEPDSLSEITFRIKDPCRPASDFGFRFNCLTGKIKEGEIYWKSGMDEIWHDSYFTPNACRYCDDIFAETADIVFMDAWLPEYQTDPLGNNLFQVRSEKLLSLISKKNHLGEISVSAISKEKIILSQIGVIRKKRGDLAYRLAFNQNRKDFYPQKRVLVEKKQRVDNAIFFWLKEAIRRVGRNEWAKNHQNFSAVRNMVFLKYILAIFTQSTQLISRLKQKILSSVRG
jgi:coenzyme F420-reducing hydrogenase beta subunit